MASKKVKTEAVGVGSGPTTIFYPIIDVDCSHWSADIPAEKKTRGRFQFRSKMATPPPEKKATRKKKPAK